MTAPARRPATTALLLGAAALLLGATTACSDPADPGTPHVTLDPLDVSPFASAPCTLLRPDRATRRHLIAPGTEQPGPEGPVCRWTPDRPHVPVITAGVDPDRGLAEIQHSPDLTVVDTTDIAHYPALHTRDHDPGNAARCTTRVGVAPGGQVLVTADDTGLAVPSALDPCSDADTLATEILGQLLANTG